MDTVIFEGPLDAESLAQVEACGKSPDPGAVPLDGLMTEAEIRRLERVVCGVRGPVARFLNMEWEDAPDVRERLHATRHWYAFFSLWTAFLERQGWRDSVDLEAWHLARDMGKTVLGMETMEEQLHSLEVVPVPRVLDFFRHCGPVALLHEAQYLPLLAWRAGTHDGHQHGIPHAHAAGHRLP